jgi:peptidoglycan-N-acetylglucosamine deacetylase
MNIKYDSVNGVIEVMLTFNDGPHATLTPKLLDLLKQENIKVMFFVLGVNVAAEKNIEIVKRAYEEGHIIGNHTYFHRNLRSLSDFEIKSEILNTEEFIKDFMTSPKFFRPPYGITNFKIDKILKDLGYVTVMCNVDAVDWKYNDNTWVENTLAQINTRQYSVVQLHDTFESTIKYLPELIKSIKSKKGQQEFISYL